MKKEKQSGTIRAAGTLRAYWNWHFVLALLLLVPDVYLLVRDQRLGLAALAFTAAYYLIMLGVYALLRPRFLQDLVAFAAGYETLSNGILEELDIPCALLDQSCRILWLNQEMCALTGKSRSFRKSVTMLFPELHDGVLPLGSPDRDVRVVTDNKEFRAHLRRISYEQLSGESALAAVDGSAGFLYLLSLFDETQINYYIRENRDLRPVVGLVYIDNYEEVLDQTDEVHQSLLSVLVERKICRYFAKYNGLIKKLEKDKYLTVFDRKSLDSLTEDRFSVLEDVKTISIGNDRAMTLSGGIGLGGKGYQEDYEYARGAIELALARGGDQIVLRNGEELLYFGGKTQQGEKNTRVKARVKAQALRELLMAQDQILAMGHKRTDMDSFGAAIGICRAAKSIGKPVHIVLGEHNSSIREWIRRFGESKEYEDLFITHERALELVNDRTAVVVVDTNRREIVECPELLERTSAVVVLDHHRQTNDAIERAALSYIEPSASSACEMIAEILQYFDESLKLRSLEADSMYAGILIDTNSFAAKTGVRTFEAAAYLRRCGADVSRVRKALRDNFEHYQAKAETISRAEPFMGVYAMSVLHGDGMDNPSVIGAQAANDLLDIENVKASFVVTQVGQSCFVSARSIDEVNVQLVMERMGGGGHLNIAGCQLDGVTAEEAIAQIQEVLKAMTEEGVIA